MLVRRRQTLEVLSISSLDLFASALGVFILIAILMFPYYLRQPSIEQNLAGARQELSAAGSSASDARQSAQAAAEARDQAEAELAQARQALRQAEAQAAAATETLAKASEDTAAAKQELGALGKKAASLAITDLDVVFVMDTTGSMKNELRDIQVNLSGIIRVLHRLAPTLRAGFVAFKDKPAKQITRAFPMTAMTTANLERMLGFVQDLRARGGGDVPEPVDQALEDAIDMTWRSEALGKIIVIGDEPAHTPNWSRSFEMASAFQNDLPEDALPRSVSTIFSGQRPRSRDYFERLARAGGGEFAAHRGQMIESVLLSVLHASPGRTP
jgi:F0F1-type ATP synthase membrane subunit b/b'